MIFLRLSVSLMPRERGTALKVASSSPVNIVPRSYTIESPQKVVYSRHCINR